MKTFIYLEAQEGGMGNETYVGEEGLVRLRKWLAERLGSYDGDTPPDWFTKCQLWDKELLDHAPNMEVGEAVGHRIGILIRLKDDHPVLDC